MSNFTSSQEQLVLDESKSLIAFAKAKKTGKVENVNELISVVNGANLENKKALKYCSVGLFLGVLAGVILR